MSENNREASVIAYLSFYANEASYSVTEYLSDFLNVTKISGLNSKTPEHRAVNI